ncbi:MAG: EfeM/EfeO family lipoprotein [Phycisphaerales bacterium]|nr:EfeM/EfeO family lipoprotein [Phycisphaerales bacterium]
MDRRNMIMACFAGSVAAPGALPLLGAATGKSTVNPGFDPRWQDSVAGGVNYFKKRCDDQIPLVKQLQKAIASGDVASAKVAYIESRPPYEEIETIAGSFMESDADIDARPYAFEGGEQDPEFRGFHKIENLIFAEEDLEAASPYADRLHQSIVRLRTELNDPMRFSPEGQFGGMVALSTEIPAKKISSEEETWSDQSLLIFKHNWIGIYSQFKPFANVPGVNTTSVKRVEDAHKAAMATVTPHFTTGTSAATPYSRIPIKERRSMADASNRYRDAIIVVRDELGIKG